MTPSDDRKQHALPASATSRTGWTVRLVVVGLILVSGLSGVLAARWLKANRAQAANAPEPSAERSQSGVTFPKHYFRGWDKPDMVLVLSGSQHGYLLPCGCSHPQLGGLERRYNFVQALREQGWTVTAVDVGDIAQMRGPQGLANEQGLLKYVYSMKALKEIGYAAVSFGEYEAALPLSNALAEYALQDPVPRVLAANLNTDNFPDQVGDWLEITQKGKRLPIRTGVTATIGPTVAAQIKDPLVVFDYAEKLVGGVAMRNYSEKALNRVLPKMRHTGIELKILLYQGYATANRLASNSGNAPKAEAVSLAEDFPQFQVVLALSKDDEPSGHPVMANNDNTLIASLGHKGRYVGVVGIWKTGVAAKPYRFKYQLVEMSEDLATPEKRAENHPIIAMIEDYNRDLKRLDMLGKYGKTKHRLQMMDPVPNLREGTPPVPQYLGSEACKKCHPSAYASWKKSDHSHAYQTLVDVKRPGLRQYDAECIVCHTTGFRFQTGFMSAVQTPHLENVGCESCHGPGSHHAKNPNNLAWRKRMNEWSVPVDETAEAKAKRRARIDDFCQGCHNIDNDVHWTHNALDRKWPKIEHFKEGAGNE